jgi:chlorobactene glucosyltransferase
MTLRTDNLRFLGLGALTAVALGGSIVMLRAMQSAEKIPEVDALAVGPPGRGDWPFLTVIVPARNEERNLPRLLPSLLSQRYPSYEVIVVDDQSTDATPRILAEWAERDARLKVVRGVELPQGWKGKPHAMHQGAQVATGEWLLFTDADTVHERLSLSSSMAFALSRRIDLLTLAPCAELVNPSERLIMPIAYQGILVSYPAHKVNDSNDDEAIANGQYIFIRRDVYDAVGGIERVKNKIAEDLEFAHVVKSAGYRLYLADGTHLMRVRMYTNLAEVWEGWSKNVVLSFQGRPDKALLAITGVLSLTLLPVLLLLWTRNSWREAQRSGSTSDRIAAGWTSVLAAWTIVMPLAYRRRVDQMLGLPPAWTFTQPVGLILFGLIMLSSLVRLLTGKGVVWKGRTYGA